jgi:predicted Zn-dependent peptidase
MKKKTFNGLDIDVYEEVLDNGLKIFLCPLDRHTVHARITTFFGGSTLEFEQNGQDIKVPAGIAHFLEHEMFEKKDGVDPVVLYENNGASGNAFTSPYITSYHFTRVSHFYDNLNILLKSIHEPYFTDENVLKEQGIILQEKKQSLDNPSYIVYERSLLNLLYNLDFKNSVLGTLDDIKSITKEDLYKCYNTFYHPSNMCLTICGGIDVIKTLDFIKKFYKNYNFTKGNKIVVKDKDEPQKVVKANDIIYKDNKNKIINISYKVPKNNLKSYLDEVYLASALDLKFGILSDMNDITLKDSNYLSLINSSVYSAGNYYIVSFKVTVKDDIKKVIDLIDNKMKDDNYNEKDFYLLKKSVVSSSLVSMENVQDICYTITNQLYHYGKVIYNMYDILKSLDFETFKEKIKGLDFSNRSVVVLESKPGE